MKNNSEERPSALCAQREPVKRVRKRAARGEGDRRAGGRLSRFAAAWLAMLCLVAFGFAVPAGAVVELRELENLPPDLTDSGYEAYYIHDESDETGRSLTLVVVERGEDPTIPENWVYSDLEIDQLVLDGVAYEDDGKNVYVIKKIGSNDPRDCYFTTTTRPRTYGGVVEDPGGDGGGEDTPPGTEATPAPSPFSDTGAYAVEVVATDVDGYEVPRINKGDHFNLMVRVVDHSAAPYFGAARTVSARLNSGAFLFTGEGTVSNFRENYEFPTHSFYYTYDLTFNDVIYDGGGNECIINISYPDSSIEMQQLTVTLGQCSVTEEGEDSRTPGLTVRESSYGTDPIVAGTPFKLDVTVFATTGSEGLSDVIASITLPKGVTLTGGSLSQYVGPMSPQGTCPLQFEVLPSAAFTEGVADLTIHLTGIGTDSGNEVSSDTVISVPVLQPDRFEITGVDCSDTIYIGQGGSVTVNYVNKGRNMVANLEAEITGNNLGVDIPRVYIGNVPAGSENSVDFSLYPENPGPMDGIITLSYESEDGTVKTLTETITSTAEEMDMLVDPEFGADGEMGEGEIGMEETQPGIPVWIWAVVGAGVIAALAVVVLLVRRRKKAKALALQEAEEDGVEEDEDF